MRFTIAAVGRIKEPYFQEAVAVYQKRMGSYGRLDVVEVKESPFKEPVTVGVARRVLEEEAERLLAVKPPRGGSVALDPRGDVLTSEEFARWLEDMASRGFSEWVFWIGGPLGLAPRVLEASHRVLSLSRLTMSHGLARVVLAEQLYRAMTIVRGDPYHK